MANEITVQASLNVRVGNQLQYNSIPSGFQDSLETDTPRGPTPGAILVSRWGTDIDLSQLDRPGWCHFHNQDDTNAIRIGIWNGDQNEFYPFLKLKPQQGFPVCLDPLINEEFSSTGTGTTGQLNTLRAIAENADSFLFVGAFEA